MTAKEHIDSVYACSVSGTPGLFDKNDLIEFMESYAKEISNAQIDAILKILKPDRYEFDGYVEDLISSIESLKII